MAAARGTRVYVEAGRKRVFACAVDWPGWCRSGRSEELALQALAEYAPRYAPVPERAGVRFPARAADSFDVAERVTGDASTDFGVPGRVPELDAGRVTPTAARRLAALVTAAWEVFDEVAAGAPEELRKGPRGGGRDRDKMIDHVLSAEAAYARKIGVRMRPPARGDRAAVEELREAIREVLARPSDGEPLVERGWPARYAARRIAWHVLDHAWEMVDRST
ncbi:MAG TPA: hypothetical protein VFM54_02835 [Micromonosporaceae bacterium]|nr:hypothetical protein [Micromonosporaceae bacterium]